MSSCPENDHISLLPRCLNVSQSAEYLGATVWFVRSQIWANKLHGIRLGSRLLVPREELDAFVDRQKVEQQ